MKKGEGANSALPSPATRAGIWRRHVSTAMSHACHIGCWYVGGRRGDETGAQLFAQHHPLRGWFRNRLATRRSWRNRRWNRGLGRAFHAMVSVIAVKIQLSSPSGVLRLFC